MVGTRSFLKNHRRMLALKMRQAQRSAKDAASAVVECTEAYEAAPPAHNMLAMQRASKELVEATKELGKQHNQNEGVG